MVSARDVKSNPSVPSLTAGFICRMRECVAIQTYNSRFVPFVLSAVLPAAGFLRSAPVLGVPRRSATKAAARLFVPPNPASRWRTMASGFPGQCGERGVGGHQCRHKLTTTAKCRCFMIRTHGVRSLEVQRRSLWLRG